MNPVFHILISEVTYQYIYIIIVAIISAEFIINCILEMLNYSKLDAAIPIELQGIYDTDKYKQMIDYQKANIKFGVVSDGFSFLLTIAVLVTGMLGKVDVWISGYTAIPLVQSLLFAGVIFMLSDILSLPFQWYGVFVIEQKYGFNKTTPMLFITDKLKGYALTATLGGGILAILIWLVQSIGQNYWLYFWAVISVFMLLINIFYTTWIVPLFNKLTPLEEGELKTKIMDYCHKVQFPIDNLYVIDGSKRSTKANAYFSGLGKRKKIVLYDTLIQNHTHEELVAVLAHEVGHFKKRHIITNILFSIVLTGITLFISSFIVFNPELSYALGGTGNKIHLNLVAFGILYSPISTLTSLMMGILSRKNEYEADAFAKNTYNFSDLVNALKKLSANNLSNLTPHPAYVFFNYSHPTLLQRIRAMG
ncbi:MAG: M48 family metallopeptidase [Cytophagales bacterium]|nr:M48 family metallopeptidase [Cytophagales bacterium]